MIFRYVKSNGEFVLFCQTCGLTELEEPTVRTRDTGFTHCADCHIKFMKN